MRKTIWGLAALSLLTLLATSCSKEINEQVESKKDNPIAFNAAVGKQTLTKATEFAYWGTTAPDNALTVKAFATGSNSAFNALGFNLTWNGTAWSYGTAVNQPGYSLTYFSHYPATAAVTTPFAVSPAPAGVGTLGYTVNGVTNQEDLIAATTISTSESVTLAFNHILSQINFAVQGMENMKIDISSISVNGVANVGTYTFSTSGGSWATPSGTAAYAYTPKVGVIPTTGANNNIVYLGNGGGTYNNNNALMLMPQSFSPAIGGNFSFNYTIKDMAEVNTLKTGSATAYFGDFSVATWAKGYRYIYLIDFTNLFVGGPIVFTVNVNSWTDAPAPGTAQTLYLADASKKGIEAAIASHAAAKTSEIIFPISLPSTVTVTPTIEIENFATGFVVGDEIHIYYTGSAGDIDLAVTVTDWVVQSDNGTVIILEKTL